MSEGPGTHYDCAVTGCKGKIPIATADDYECAGCGALICDAHLGDPWGSHHPDDHDNVDFDEDYK